MNSLIDIVIVKSNFVPAFLKPVCGFPKGLNFFSKISRLKAALKRKNKNDFFRTTS
jgi:hypothetical protein